MTTNLNKEKKDKHIILKAWYKCDNFYRKKARRGTCSYFTCSCGLDTAAHEKKENTQDGKKTKTIKTQYKTKTKKTKTNTILLTG